MSFDNQLKKGFPDGGSLKGKVGTFPDGGMTDRKCLSWRKRENRRRRFFLTGITVREWSVTVSVRESPLSLTVYH